MMGKVVLILGILGMLLGFGVALVSLLLPSMTSNVSPSEAAIGIAAGVVVLAAALVLTLVGVIILVVKRNRSKV